MQGQGGQQQQSGQPLPNQGGQKNASGAQQQRPTIAIPSYKEVQQAQRAPAAAPNFFRASSAPQTGGSSSFSAAPAHPSSRAPPPPQQQHNPLAFIGGPSAPQYPQPGSYGQPPGPGSSHPQQQQQYYGRPPPMQHQHSINNRPAAAGPPLYPPAQQQSYQNYQQPPRPPPGASYPPPQRPHYAGAPPPQPQQQYQQQQQQQPQAPSSLPPINPNAIIVSPRQQGNPVLKYIRNVRWQYGDIIPDYQLGQSTAALFLSLRYHLLKPEYVHARMKELANSRSQYRLRVLLVHVDTEDAVEPLAQVTRASIGNDFTLLCGFNNAECARYLETLKSYEKKPAETIQKDLGTDYVSRATSALTTIRGVNRTDVKTLGDKFGSMAAVMQATEVELKSCAGIGPVKAKRLFETFHEPFRRSLVANVGQSGAEAGGSWSQQAAAGGDSTLQPGAVVVVEEILDAGGDENDDEEEESQNDLFK